MKTLETSLKKEFNDLTSKGSTSIQGMIDKTMDIVQDMYDKAQQETEIDNENHSEDEMSDSDMDKDWANSKLFTNDEV